MDPQRSPSGVQTEPKSLRIASRKKLGVRKTTKKFQKISTISEISVSKCRQNFKIISTPPSQNFALWCPEFRFQNLLQRGGKLKFWPSTFFRGRNFGEILARSFGRLVKFWRNFGEILFFDFPGFVKFFEIILQKVFDLFRDPRNFAGIFVRFS